ncbi:hypothetical protein BDA99DRAFT_417030, partial [Phascolomyces articulosus]
YHGFENEDFRTFRQEFTSYILLTGAQTENRRLELLQGVLRVPALTQYLINIIPNMNKDHDEQHTTYTVSAALDSLEEYFITDYDLQRYRDYFSTITQRYGESPQSFLGRVHQAAYDADIKNTERIESTFKAGLLPEIRKHCIKMCAMEHKDILQKAEGYWNAERQDRLS